MKQNKKDTPRRAPLLRFRTVLFLFVCFLVGVVVIVSTVGGRFGLFHQFTLETIGTAQSILTSVSSSMQTVWGGYVDLVDVRRDNERLRALIDAKDEELARYREAYRTYLRLQEELEFRQNSEFPPLTARVIGKDPSLRFQTIIVDRGANDGVTEGMVALTSRGIVGSVIHVSFNYSKILLANAPSSAIDVIIQKNRVRGILKGAGENGFTLEYVLKKENVSAGDRIVTAGIGGLFPPGKPVGTVVDVQREERGMFLIIQVEPAVDFSRLEFVFLNLSLAQSLEDQAPFTVGG